LARGISFFGFVGGALLGAEFGPAFSRACRRPDPQDGIAVVLLQLLRDRRFIGLSIGAAMRPPSPALGDRADSLGGSASALSRCC